METEWGMGVRGSHSYRRAQYQCLIALCLFFYLVPLPSGKGGGHHAIQAHDPEAAATAVAAAATGPPGRLSESEEGEVVDVE